MMELVTECSASALWLGMPESMRHECERQHREGSFCVACHSVGLCEGWHKGSLVPAKNLNADMRQRRRARHEKRLDLWLLTEWRN